MSIIQKDSLWQAILGEIELSISHGNFMTWFKNSKLIEVSGEKVIIGVQNIFIKQQLTGKYQPLIIALLEKNGLKDRTIEYKILSVSSKKTANSTNETVFINSIKDQSPENISVNSSNFKRPIGANTLSHSYRQGINQKYKLDNFIVGSGNDLAFAACQAIASHPGTKYNPLFLYGGVGIGKTHLIQAVGNAILQNNPNSRVLYISTEQFVQEFVDALRFRKTTDFAGYYRSADVLIVDDVQFIAGKEKIQEEFFHTFNALHQANKQIIITSDKPPKDIPTLEERLRSRFAWGMSIDMQIPDFETRCAIIQTKTQEQSLDLPTEVVEFLANNIQTNIRELEGALNQLLAFCEMRALDPTLEIATSLLGTSAGRPKHLSSKIVIERIAKHFQISQEDIIGPKRDKDIVVPRQIAMYMLRSELHLSYPKIAKELGRKDHTTAMHSVEKIDKEMKFDADIRQAVTAIKARLYA